MNLSASKKTILITISGILNLFVSSLFLFVLGRLILQYFGSDYNGINSTINQIVSILSVLEGGFTTASVVALFKPYSENNKTMVDSILSTTNYAFKNIGLISFLVGIILSILYAIVVKSNIDFFTLLIVFLMAIIATSFNFYFSLKYQIIFQVNQCEFIVNFVYIVCNIIFQIISIIVIIFYKNIVIVRFVNMLQIIIQGLIIALISKKLYPNVSYSSKKDFSLIKGTKDVYIGKITSVVYNSSAVFFISMFVSTAYTSVYSVYNLPITLIKNILYTIINSLQNFLGKLNVTVSKEILLDFFNKYEYCMIILINYCFSIMSIIIIPFVKIYTSGVNDINYININLATLLMLIGIIELLLVPSGILINMSGNFKTSKNIQLQTCLLLIICNIMLSTFFGFFGIIISTLIASVFLCFREVYFIKSVFFKINYKKFFIELLINFFCFIVNLLIAVLVVSSVDMNIIKFLILTLSSICFNIILFIGINYLFNFKDFSNLLKFIYIKFINRRKK